MRSRALRIAVGLPSGIPVGAPHRRAFEATVSALAEGGADVECFAEHDRLAEPVGELPIFHYLRLPERHGDRSFDAALYPLERDTGPYASIYWMMRRFPGFVWLHDPALHHMAVAGLALTDRVSGYLALLEREHGERAGVLAEAVVEGWGSAAFYRRFDLTRTILAGQPGIATPWEALARRLAPGPDGAEVATIPLPPVAGPGPVGRRGGPAAGDRGGGPGAPGDRDPAGDGAEAGGGRALFRFVSTNASYLSAEMAALEAVAGAFPEARLEVCLPSVIRDVVYGPAAARRALGDRIAWLAVDEWDELAAAVEDDADLLVFLREDLRGGELALIQRALAAGTPVAVPDLPLYEDLPEGVVAKLPFGGALGPGLVALTRELLSDGALRRGMAAAARAWVDGLPDPDGAAAAWVDWIEGRIEAGAEARLQPVSTPTWERLRADLEHACVPDGMAAGPAAAIRSVLEEQTELVRGDRG